MIRKPRSVSWAGTLTVAAGLIWLVATGANHFMLAHERLDAVVAVVVLLGSWCALWWSVGTLIHQWRVNRMRYTQRERDPWWT